MRAVPVEQEIANRDRPQPTPGIAKAVPELMADPITLNIEKVELEYVNGKSDKFYRVERAGSTVRTTWGRNGTAGQTKTKAFSTPREAAAWASEKIQEKRDKGYLLK